MSTQDRVARLMLTSLNAAIDPLLIATIAQLIIEAIKMLNECRNQPTAYDVREICRKPSGVHRALVARKARDLLGAAQYRTLGGRRLVDAGFKAILGCDDTDIRVLLSE
jgi:hypothetical protein